MEEKKDYKKIFKWDEDETQSGKEDLASTQDKSAQKKVSKKVLKRLEKEKEKLRKKGIIEANKKSKLTAKGKSLIISICLVILIGISIWVLFGYYGIGIDLTKTLAKIDNMKVTEKELKTYLDFLEKQNSTAIPAKNDPQYTVLKQNLLDSIIVLKLIQKSGQANYYVITDKDINDEIIKLKSNYKSEEEFNNQLKDNKITLKFLSQQIKNQLLRDKIFADITKNVTVSDDDIKKYYEDNKDTLFTVPYQIRVSHILIKFPVEQGKEISEADKKKAKDKILEIQDKLNKGEDFAELAKKYSDDSVSGPSGGDIGFISKGQTIPEFENAAFSLEIGQISDIVETTYGYHLIKVTDKQDSYVKQFDDVKETIKSYLITAEQTKAWEEFIYSLVEKAKIVYTTDLKGQLSADIIKNLKNSDDKSNTSNTSITEDLDKTSNTDSK